MQILPIISKFNFGEVSPYLAARVDLPKHQAGCRKLENFIPLLQGPLKRRGGTRFVARSGNGDKPVALIDFAFSETTTYILEVGDGYMRFFYRGAPVLDNDGEIYQIATPWTQADLFLESRICALKWVQSGDVMYIVCPGQPPQKLSRYGHTDWRVGPLGGWDERPNATAVAMFRERLVLAAGQTVYMSQSGAFENFKLRGANLTKLTAWSSSSWTWDAATGILSGGSYSKLSFRIGEAAAAISGQNVTVTAIDQTAGLSKVLISTAGGTTTMDNLTGHLANTNWNGFSWTTYLTVDIDAATSEFEKDLSDDTDRTYRVVSSTTAVAADDPIEIGIYSEQMDRVEWLVPAGKLLAGTTGDEFLIGETTETEPFGPENIRVVPETTFGSSAIQALRVGAVVLFVQRAGRKVREFVYDFQGDNYVAMDVTVAAEHVTRPELVATADLSAAGDSASRGGLTAMLWQSEPIETLWCVRSDGQLLGFTYSKDQDMTAWHRHILGGGGEVSHIAVVPAVHGGRDILWLSVKRLVAGETVYYLETMTQGHELGDPPDAAFFVDSGRTFVGEGLTEITGLDHLEGHEVAVLGDGGVQPRRVVAGGRIELQYPADVVQVGLPYISTVTTSNLEAQLPDGTAQSRKKRFTKATLWLLESLGGEAGHDPDDMERLEYRHGNDSMDAPPRLASGFYTVNWPHGYEDEGALTVRQTFPLPFTLAAIIPEVNMEGKN